MLSEKKLKKIGVGVGIVCCVGGTAFKSKNKSEFEKIEIKENVQIEKINNFEVKEIKKVEEVYPERFMRSMGKNLCASYVKLIAQSKGFDFKKTYYMNSWEMAYNMDKEGWKKINHNEILNLIMLEKNLEKEYHNSSIKRIHNAKNQIDFSRYVEIKKCIENKEYETARVEIKKVIEEKFNELPDGTMLFTIHNSSKYKRKANKYKKGAPTHVIIKSNNKWRDYMRNKERIMSVNEMLRTTKNITHIITPPESKGVKEISIKIPKERRRELWRIIDFSQNEDISMWQYISYKIYENKGEGEEIIIKKNN